MSWEQGKPELSYSVATLLILWTFGTNCNLRNGEALRPGPNVSALKYPGLQHLGLNITGLKRPRGPTLMADVCYFSSSSCRCCAK
jgi:hypothetical protein